MLTSKISSKGQTTIPKDIRDRFHLSPGDHLAYTVENGDIVIRPMTENFLDHAGSIKPSQKPEQYSQIREQVKSDVATNAAEK